MKLYLFPFLVKKIHLLTTTENVQPTRQHLNSVSLYSPKSRFGPTPKEKTLNKTYDSRFFFSNVVLPKEQFSFEQFHGDMN